MKTAPCPADILLSWRSGRQKLHVSSQKYDSAAAFQSFSGECQRLLYLPVNCCVLFGQVGWSCLTSRYRLALHIVYLQHKAPLGKTASLPGFSCYISLLVLSHHSTASVAPHVQTEIGKLSWLENIALLLFSIFCRTFHQRWLKGGWSTDSVLRCSCMMRRIWSFQSSH